MHGDPFPTRPNCQDGDPAMLPFEAARQRMLDPLTPVPGTVTWPVRDTLGMVLAEEIRAPVDVPSHTNAAVDGYAVRGDDLREGETVVLRLCGDAFAGHPFTGGVAPGQCVRIMTGAPMPAGTDTAIMQEHTVIDSDRVSIAPGRRPGENVRKAGEDIQRGAVALTSGTVLHPAHIGLLASLGRAEVRIRRPLRVAFFSTGDELRSVGEPLGPGEIYDSNRYTLHGMLRRLNVDIVDLGVVCDQPQALRAAFARAAESADVLLTSGGVSVGEADYVRGILEELGQVEFWKIAMKPGRPFACGRIGDCRFFGLPGNPVAVMVTFYELVQPALRRLQGITETDAGRRLQLPCRSRLRKKPGRTEFLRGIIEPGADGGFEVRTTGPQGSGILRSMSEANCFIILPHDSGDLEPGALVEVQPFDGLV
ncbi:MAG: molybdopterin molybdotransferase MoeA [Gammaproteobacteria bacterium]